MTKINLHIGPHKTATTHMQNVMERSTFSDGAKFVPLWKIRKTLSSHLNHGEVPQDIDYLDHDGLLLISEENFSGFPLSGVKFYPKIKNVLTFFADHDVTLYFSPRHYATFIPSVYCEALRFSKFFKFPDVQLERGWVEVLQDVEAALPNAEIRLWPYESYRAHWKDIMSYFSDGTIREYGVPPAGDPRSTLSQKAINTYAAMHEFVTEPNMVLTVLGGALPAGVSNPKFAPFDIRKIEALSQKYEQDWRVLSERYDVFDPNVFAKETA